MPVDECYQEAYPLDDDSDMSPEERKLYYERFSEALKTVLLFGKELHSWFSMLAREGIRIGSKKVDGSSSHTFDSSKLQHSLLSSQLLPKGSEKEIQLRAAFSILAGSKGTGDWSAAHDKLVARFRPSAAAIVCVEKFLYFSYYFNSVFPCSSTSAFASSEAEGEQTFVSNSQFYRCNITMAPSEGPSNNNRRSSNQFRVLRKSDLQKGGSKWLDAKGKPMSRQPKEEVKKVESIRPGHDITLSLWCMVPSVAFMDAFNYSRSVVLASGTLCPTETLRSELGLDFQCQMEGEQVISKERIFASVLAVGPTGKSLNATYKNIASGSEFIWELAKVVVSTCFTVPKGILCFVSSYKVMDLLMECLKTHPHLQQKKKLLEEPRRSNELQSVLEEYSETIKEPELVGPNCDGALMVAVFRGKVSEGIDFSDDKARCVICVGIPFPNAYDDLVLQKKLFNNEHCRSTALLGGDEWYTTQAYRALNQALGRCLRHKEDWGALLLVDERFLNKADAKNSNTKKISKEPKKVKKEEVLMSEEEEEVESVEEVKIVVPKTSNFFK
uniref:ATP-dependent helicase C-terminal domain-containing protein n=1 Tax=Ditylenchus dipsaci TaxID=166011 RepID=A0A915DDK8_9BILA